MEAQDRTPFDDAWQHALENQECSTSIDIWKGIENSLDGKVVRRNTKHIWLLKLAMAASVLFAMTTAGLYFQTMIINPADTMAERKFNVPEENAPVITDTKEFPLKNNPLNNLNGLQTLLAEQTENTGTENTLYAELTDLFTNPEKISHVFKNYLSQPAEKYYQPALPVYSRKRQVNNELAWASLNLSGGSFSGDAANPNTRYNVSSGLDHSGYNNYAASSMETSSKNYNIGIGVGKKISSRWIIQSGVNYSERSANGWSNVVANINERQSVLTNFSSLKETNGVQLTSPYQVDHRMQYVNVPLQMGYVVMDKKVDVTLLAGVSADFLLKHQIADASGTYAKTTLRENSDFNKIAASAVVSAEVSYPLGDHYAISVYPQVKQYVTSLVKNETSDYPLSMEMGFKISYLF